MAIAQYEQCLTLNPKSPAIYTALGYSHHLKGDFKQALAYYHKSSFLKNEDIMTESLVMRALHDINEFSMDDVYVNNQSINLGLMATNESGLGPD